MEAEDEVNTARIDPSVLAEARRRYLAGEQVKVIENDLDMPYASLSKYTAHLPQRYAQHEARRLQILACLDTGLDVYATIAKVGCRPSAVVNIIRSARREAENTAELARPRSL